MLAVSGRCEPCDSNLDDEGKVCDELLGVGIWGWDLGSTVHVDSPLVNMVEKPGKPFAITDAGM
jgi:hypothetical protein